MAGLLREAHGTAAGAANSASSKRIDVGLATQQPAVSKVADVNRSRHRRDRFDLLRIANDKGTFRESKLCSGDFRQNLTSFVDDQEVDEVEKVLGRPLPAVAPREGHLAG